MVTAPDIDWGTVVFVRPPPFAHRHKSYEMFMNGDFIGEIACRQEWTLGIPEGEYTFSARRNWYSSNALTIDVEPGWVYHVEVGSNLEGWRGLLAPLWAVFCPSRILYLRLARRTRYDGETVGVRDIEGSI